ncbi:hypothetical protein [Rubinisphaera margarita]|uniref:hypothetical protein n=1 Tax=Rubinisphaera margarita TaxID=2909586 RepID=UPI001EE98290|nr:hypothetical protein [Rubinisphaera margarita]MCG6155136.1 hypothetical protein [Rubinisphaera margarita]
MSTASLRAFRHLFWKEWYLLLRLGGLMLVAGTILIIGIGFDTSPHEAYQRSAEIIGLLTVALGLAAGAAMFASETEYRTDLLLRRLAVPRPTIWQAKLSAAFTALIVLWATLTIASLIVLFFSTLFTDNGGRLSGFQPNLPQALMFLTVAVQAMLLGSLISSQIRNVLGTLVLTVIVMVTGVVFLAETMRGGPFLSADTELARTMLVNGICLFVLIVANALALPRWTAGKRLSWDWAETSTERQSRVLELGHTLSPFPRFASRFLWLEVRQSIWIWLAVALGAILYDTLINYHNAGDLRSSLTWVAVPFILGIASAYRDRQPERARFWYNRGCSAVGFWSMKTAIWLTVTFPLFTFLYLLPWMILPDFSAGGNRHLENVIESLVPSTEDYASNPWVFALALFLLGQWATIRLPKVVIVFSVAMACALALLIYVPMHLSQVSYVPLWVFFTPILIALVINNLRATSDTLRDLDEPGTWLRRFDLPMPAAVVIALIGFFSYRMVTVVEIPARTAFKLPPDPELALKIGPEGLSRGPYQHDDEYQQRYEELVDELPNHDDLDRIVKEAVRAQLGANVSPHSGTFQLKERDLYWSYRRQLLEEAREPLQELAALMQRQYVTAQPMQLDLSHIWHPQQHTPYEEWKNSFGLPVEKIIDLLRPTYRPDREERYFSTLSIAETLRLAWNLDRGHQFLSRFQDYVTPVSNFQFLGFHQSMILAQLAHESTAEELRELAKEARDRQNEITPLADLLTLDYCGILYELEHDDTYFWLYLSKFIQLSNEIYRSQQYQQLVHELMYGRITLLPSEYERARRLVDIAQRGRNADAERIDQFLRVDAPLNQLWPAIEERNWSLPLPPEVDEYEVTREFESTLAVNDLIYRRNNLYQSYVELIRDYRFLTTELALLAYAKENEAYPATLIELVPDYLDALPLDPWTAEPFEYLGPNFAGTIEQRYGKEITRFPLLWSRGYQGLELVASPIPETPDRYIVVSPLRYRDLLLQRTDGTIEVGPFERELEKVQEGFSSRPLPSLNEIRTGRPDDDEDEAEND